MQILEKKKTIHDLIKRASSIDDPLSPFDSFRRYRRNGKFVLLLNFIFASFSKIWDFVYAN